MIKDLILDVDLLPFMFDVLKSHLEVFVEETLELHILDKTILVLIDFFEELQKVFTFQRNAKEIRHL